MEESQNYRKPTLFQSLIPITFLTGALFINVWSIYGDEALGGANQLALLLSAALAGGIALYNNVSWNHLLHSIIESIKTALPAVIILLLIGSLVGSWLLAGIIPAMIYYGLQILHPAIFLVASCVICAVISLATGSSWSTIGTIGVALLGIGQILGFHEGWIAGAVISGAYFGDKMSPLSDTTNLAAAMSETDLFKHIRYMMLTTVPSIAITLVIFGLMGFMGEHGGNVNIDSYLVALESSFNLSPLLFLVPIAVIIMIMRKVPAIPALLFGSLLACLFALIFQSDKVLEVASINSSGWQAYAEGIINSLTTDIAIVSGNEVIDELLSASGMSGMLNTVWLVICAMSFGGAMESAGFLQRITQEVLKLASNTASLVATTAGTCIFFNFTASDQYLAIVVPGRMFKPAFERMKLKAENLSRTLEDSGTVTSVLIPWNTCGAYQSGVLGVATLAYAPFCFFNWISPLMSVAYAIFDIKIAKEDSVTEEN